MKQQKRMFPVRVTDIQQLTPLIKQFTIERFDRRDFPEFTPGSHIIVQMGNQIKFANAYSLMSSVNDLGSYQFSVRRDEAGHGGSIFLHDNIRVGSRLIVSEPSNLFSLADEGSKHLLIAGGIGITPFVNYLDELANRDEDYELHYAFRSPEQGAFWEDFKASNHHDRCHFYINSEGEYLNLHELLKTQPEGTHLYICGPKPLLDETIKLADELGYPEEQVHWEQFTSTAPTDGKPFKLVLSRTGQTLEVGADQTILQAIESLNLGVESLCREGVCGTCEAKILEGEADHYDQYLSSEEREKGEKIMICVSRAKGEKLVLDL